MLSLWQGAEGVQELSPCWCPATPGSHLPCFQLKCERPRIQNSWLSKWISPRGGRKAWASSPFSPSKQRCSGEDQQSVWLKV